MEIVTDGGLAGGVAAGTMSADSITPSPESGISESAVHGGSPSGRLIIFEGPDGVGKSTVAAAVAAAFRVERAGEFLSFPGREPGTLGHLVYGVHHDSGRFGISSITPAAVQTLHIAAHLDAIERRIIPALRAGRDVVLDRFWWSTLVYGTVAGLTRALMAALIDVERRAWGEYQPRLAVLLRRDSPIGRDEENRARWMALRDEYDGLALSERDRYAVLVVDNAPSAAAACHQVLTALRPPASRATDAWAARGLGGAREGSSLAPLSHPEGAGPPGREPHVGFKTPARDQTDPSPNARVGGLPRSGRGRAGSEEQLTIPMGSGAGSLPRSIHGDSADRSAGAPAAGTPAAANVFVRHLAPAKVTAVYETYWRFAAERQRVFFRRVEGEASPWTDDPILATYKFTNAYRAADRVSQYLIRHVIYREDLPPTPEEVCFRILLFKFFNKIDTWQLLERELGPVTWAGFRTEDCDRVLTGAMAQGRRIYSAAYIMPPGARAFGHTAKHRNHLALLELMMADELPARLGDARSMQQVFELLRGYPTIGDFLAYQFVTDINYSNVTNFSEMEFVVPGPGALSGIRKCFADTGGLNEPEIIRLVTELQAQEFGRLELDFRSLWGRPLQLVDCQNLFCEVDKYARVRHPDIAGRAGRTQIKQRFASAGPQIEYWFPPKWQLNAHIGRDRTQRRQLERNHAVRNFGGHDPDGTLELVPAMKPGGPPA